MCVLDVRDEATISFVPKDDRDECRGAVGGESIP